MNAVQRMDDAKCGKGDLPLTVSGFRRLSWGGIRKYPLPYLPFIDRFVINGLFCYSRK